MSDIVIWEALFLAAYAPLLLWGPFVAAATFDYWRRHTTRVAIRSHMRAPSRRC